MGPHAEEEHREGGRKREERVAGLQSIDPAAAARFLVAGVLCYYRHPYTAACSLTEERKRERVSERERASKRKRERDRRRACARDSRGLGATETRPLARLVHTLCSLFPMSLAGLSEPPLLFLRHERIAFYVLLESRILEDS